MKLKFLAAIVTVGLLFTACKQSPKVNNDQNKSQIAKKERSASNSNTANKKSNAKKELEARKKKIKQELEAKKKSGTNKTPRSKVIPKKNTTTPSKSITKNTSSAKLPVGSNSKLNTAQYYAELKKVLKLDDNKIRGIEGINKAFDQKISTMPKIKGKLNLTEIKKINELRASSLKRFLTDPVYKKKLAFDAKYSRNK